MPYGEVMEHSDQSSHGPADKASPVGDDQDKPWCPTCDRPATRDGYCCINCAEQRRNRYDHTVDCDIYERIRRSRQAQGGR